jgi:hypothetical protein
VSARGRSDFRAADLCASVALGLAVVLGAGVAASAVAPVGRAAVPEPEPPTSVSVRITPVVELSPDAPLLKLGGQRDPGRLPDRVLRPVPKVRAEERVFVSSKAGKTVDAIPAPDVKMAPADAKPPPPNAELTKQVDTPLAAVVDAGAPANVDTPGHADGVKDGTEQDPLKARAVDLYRAKLAAWFSSRFRVSGSGLGKDDLLRYRVSAAITVGADRTVSGFSIAASGNPAFDAAARATLEGAKGQALPPPPENYPDVTQNRISVTFVCRENRCD